MRDTLSFAWLSITRHRLRSVLAMAEAVGLAYLCQPGGRGYARPTERRRPVIRLANKEYSA